MRRSINRKHVTLLSLLSLPLFLLAGVTTSATGAMARGVTTSSLGSFAPTFAGTAATGCATGCNLLTGPVNTPSTANIGDQSGGGGTVPAPPPPPPDDNALAAANAAGSTVHAPSVTDPRLSRMATRPLAAANAAAAAANPAIPT